MDKMDDDYDDVAGVLYDNRYIYLGIIYKILMCIYIHIVCVCVLMVFILLIKALRIEFGSFNVGLTFASLSCSRSGIHLRWDAQRVFARLLLRGQREAC